MKTQLPEALSRAVDERLKQADQEGWAKRLWGGDASLWTGADEAKWLGWLPAAEGKQVDFAQLKALTEKAKGFDNAVLLGMGGSSLGPEVLSLILGSWPGQPKLHVLDTTDPGQIATVEAAIDPKATLFIISSKSGSTLEPELLREYFFDKAESQGEHFVAVTDPGSNLEKTAKADGYAMIFPGDKTIGGRYSVLSVFGMVPAAVMGIDVEAFYQATAKMVAACGAGVAAQDNPGVHLGVIMGEAAVSGRDKLTILPSKGVAPLGAWLEQLIAESTGKLGRGIVPVDLEPNGPVEDYGADRLFVHIHLAEDDDPEVESWAAALEKAGHPVIKLTVPSKEALGQEFVLWEIATAISGAVIGINPFDQPDVEDAKIATRKLVDAYEASGSLDPETPVLETADFAFFTEGASVEAPADVQQLLALHFANLTPGKYAGFLAYIERDAAIEAAIAAMREVVVKAKQVATVAGFGPRFLHSTGQAYKGGPNSGVFLTITRDPDPDLPIPDRKASFGTVQIAQARGDAAVLAKRGRAVLRVHLKKGGGGIEALTSAVTAALLS